MHLLLIVLHSSASVMGMSTFTSRDEGAINILNHAINFVWPFIERVQHRRIRCEGLEATLGEENYVTKQGQTILQQPRHSTTTKGSIVSIKARY